MPIPDALTSYLERNKKSNPSYTVIKIDAHHLRKAGQLYLKGILLDIGSGEKRKEILLGDFVDSYLGLDHPISYHDTSKLDMFGTAYEIPLATNSIDSVLCTAVLEHLEEPSQAISEAYRVLKSGGYAIYTMPFFWHLHEQPRDFYRYSPYGLQHLFEKNQFEIVEIQPLSGFWITFLTELNYYIYTYKTALNRIKLGWIISAIIMLNHLLMSLLDRGILRREAFTWAHILIARKP